MIFVLDMNAKLIFMGVFMIYYLDFEERLISSEEVEGDMKSALEKAVIKSQVNGAYALKIAAIEEKDYWDDEFKKDIDI